MLQFLNYFIKLNIKTLPDRLSIGTFYSKIYKNLRWVKHHSFIYNKTSNFIINLNVFNILLIYIEIN